MPAVYCLVEKEDVEQAEAKLAAYERSNLQDIIQNEARKVQASAALQHVLITRQLSSLTNAHCKLTIVFVTYIY